MKRILLLGLLLGSLRATAIAPSIVPSLVLKPEQLSFDYLASDGGFWLDCTHKKLEQTHSWRVTCSDYKFDLHLMLTQYADEKESTYEFHYWAHEFSILKQNQTQSTWVTVDRLAKAKRIIAYLGFGNDSTQLRLNVDLSK